MGESESGWNPETGDEMLLSAERKPEVKSETPFRTGLASGTPSPIAGPPEESDVNIAFSLLAVDPSLQGVCLWGERSDIVDEFVRRLAASRREGGVEPTCIPPTGPADTGVVRVPVYATPSDVLWPPPGTSAASPFPAGSMNLLERARSGVLVLESPDLLAEATAAALMRSLNRMSPWERPLLIARSREHPSLWPLIAAECAFWVEEPGRRGTPAPGTNPGPEGRFPALAYEPNDGRAFARHDDPSAPRQSGHRPKILPTHLSERLLEQLTAAIPPAMDNAHGVNFFVARTASALAALEGAAEVNSHHVRRALRLVVERRLTAVDARPAPDRRAEPSTPSEAHPVAGQSPQPEKSGRGQTVDGDDVARATGSRSSPGRDHTPGGRATDDHALGDRATGDPAQGAQGRLARKESDTAAPDGPVPEVVVSPAELFPALSLDIGESGTPTPAEKLRTRRRRNGPANRPGPPTGGAIRHRRGHTLAIAATIYAALPWQRLRRWTRGVPADGLAAAAAPAPVAGPAPASMKGNALHIRPEDLRSRRRKPNPKTLYILAVDGSGSMARGRMHLAKGAALAVLAGAYRERRYVSLIDFRGTNATLLCPPGRSSTTIRRLLYDLPAGGGTPLPAALSLARDTARCWLRNNDDGRVRLILFTDGKANVPLGHGLNDSSLRDPGVGSEGGNGVTSGAAGAGRGAAGDRRGAAGRRAAVREEIRRLGRDLHGLGVDMRIVDDAGWQPHPELHELAAALGALVVRIDRRRFAG